MPCCAVGSAHAGNWRGHSLILYVPIVMHDVGDLSTSTASTCSRPTSSKWPQNGEMEMEMDIHHIQERGIVYKIQYRNTRTVMFAH